jgi:hypothetical protein
MAISGKCGKVHIPKIGEVEPVFILRAQDQPEVDDLDQGRGSAAARA